MKVFHGSDIPIVEIDLTKCRPGRDFGRGFYVTKFYHQAESMAIRVSKWSDAKPVVTEFEFDEYAYECQDVSLLQFNSYDEKWLDFVILNRKNKSAKPAHSYDIVEGPVADDAIAIRIDDFLRGKVSIAQFLEELKFKTPSHQICFCTLQSLWLLERVNNVAENELFHLDDRIIQQLILDYGLSELKASDLFYTSATYAQVIDEWTDFFKKPWMEIYQMLLIELKY